MLKELFQYLIGLGTVEQMEINGQKYSTQPIHLLRQPTPEPLVVRNLSGLVDYLKINYDELGPVLIQVASPTKVHVYSSFNQNSARNHYLSAEAIPPQIPFEKFMDIEAFNVLLQSCFVDTDWRARVLQVVGNVRDENVASFGDDGVSQQVTVKAGVATLQDVKVPNPVLLKPFRTFVDIEQPESQFVFRMRKGQEAPTAALFEADGGAWRLSAIHGIRNYLLGLLGEELDAKRVTIIA